MSLEWLHKQGRMGPRCRVCRVEGSCADGTMTTRYVNPNAVFNRVSLYFCPKCVDTPQMRTAIKSEYERLKKFHLTKRGRKTKSSLCEEPFKH